jgi:protein CpxP
MKRYAAFMISVLLFSGAVMFATGTGSTMTRLIEGRRQGSPPPPPPQGPALGPPTMEHMARDLNLTDQQKTQVKQILDAERSVIDPLLTQLGAFRTQLDAATANGQFNEDQVRAIAVQQAQTTAELTVEHERVKSKIYNILTPDQREKAKQARAWFDRPGRRPRPEADVSVSN